MRARVCRPVKKAAKPVLNDYIERINRTYREEVLNTCAFDTQDEVPRRPRHKQPQPLNWRHHCLVSEEHRFERNSHNLR